MVIINNDAPRFDQLILVAIFASSLTMAIERPSIEKGTTERVTLDALNYTFAAIFFIEFAIKVVAWSLFTGPNAYIKDAWNRLDGFLVGVSFVDIIFKIVGADAGGVLRILRIVRLLRTLRPLRLISRAPKLKLVVRTLVASLETIVNTVAISGIVFLIFAILGIQLFAGKFSFCADPATGERIDSNVELAACRSMHNGTVAFHTFNYDNIGNAFLTLFYVASFDGWVEQMLNSVDAVGVGMNMQRDANPGMALFYVGFLLLGNFFVLNMFIGVIVDSFQRALEPDETLTEEETKQKIVDEQHMAQELMAQELAEEASIADTSYTADYEEWQLRIWRLARTTQFEIFITVVITLNVLTMALEHHDEDPTFTLVLDMLNFLFTGIFTVELFIKVTAFGWERYFRENWNRFDFLIVIVSYVGIVFDTLSASAPINPSLLRILRVFRVTRILKLLKTAQGVRALLDCVFKSMAQITNMMSLLLLYFFIYAAAGVELFGKLGCGLSRCKGISKHANFTDFGYALLTLFRICTGDNGNGILIDAMREPPDCDDRDDCQYNCCASRVIAPIYFITFTVVAQFVLLNVVVAVLMAQLEESAAQADDSFQKEVAIEEQGRKEGREIIRSESVQALITLREGKLQKPRSDAEEEKVQARRDAKRREQDLKDEDAAHAAEILVLKQDALRRKPPTLSKRLQDLGAREHRGFDRSAHIDVLHRARP